ERAARRVRRPEGDPAQLCDTRPRDTESGWAARFSGALAGANRVGGAPQRGARPKIACVFRAHSVGRGLGADSCEPGVVVPRAQALLGREGEIDVTNWARAAC